jgi:glutamine amidotransferase
MKNTVIVDYGMGNLRSVQKALERVGHGAAISADPNRVAEAAKILLPGVGAFGDTMARLREKGLVAPLIELIRAGKPFLGICLGLQLLFRTGYEDGEHAGLGLLAGQVMPLQPGSGLKVPHMGWNQLRIRRRAPLLEGVADQASVYFVHSYYAVPADPSLAAAETDYPTPFVSMIWQENLFATQFHPEKSQSVGLRILRNFAALA